MRFGAAAILWLLVAGCGGQNQRTDFGWVDGTNPRNTGLKAPSVRWTFNLTPSFEGRYVPVEHASAALDPRNGRLFVGSSTGVLHALEADGRPLYQYDAGAGIEARPELDPVRGQLFIGTTTGQVHALNADDGSLRWQVAAGGSVSASGHLSDDALYLVTDDDSVVALSREDGEVLWRYRREPRDGFAIAGHAGLARADRRILAAFGDGAVVALDASDGKLFWETDTSLDVEDPEDDRQFVDVDTTPVVVGDTVYVASFAAGLYGLEIDSGTAAVRREDLTGITHIAADQTGLFLSSADRGVVCLDLPGHGPRWAHRVERGSPAHLVPGDGVVYVTETRGALLALNQSNGEEAGRVESGHGFSAAPTMLDGRGFILSNAGTLFAFTY